MSFRSVLGMWSFYKSKYICKIGMATCKKSNVNAIVISLFYENI